MNARDQGPVVRSVDNAIGCRAKVVPKINYAACPLNNWGQMPEQLTRSVFDSITL